MTIGIIGESCVGKSTIADELAKRIGAAVYTGKDYTRLAKNEAEALQKFVELLNSDEKIIYVITDEEHVALLPEKSVRIVITADLETIKERFAQRTKGVLPPPVAVMLERKHGVFNNLDCDLRLEGTRDVFDLCDKIIEVIGCEEK